MNKIAVITGGSRGIGKAAALQFAEQGYDIIITYRSKSDVAESVVAQIRDIGQEAEAFALDIKNDSAVVQFFEKVKALGSLKVLVNNAGILDTQGPLTSMSTHRMRNVLETNVLGTLVCCREAIPLMSSKQFGDGGSIINVGSGASRTGSPFEYVDYAASKGAVDSLTVGLAKELAEEGIRVNCVRPGPILTDIHADGGEPDRVERVKERLPLKRGGTPEEVAAAIVFLASDASSFTTGAMLDVSGGA